MFDVVAFGAPAFVVMDLSIIRTSGVPRIGLGHSDLLAQRSHAPLAIENREMVVIGRCRRAPLLTQRNRRDLDSGLEAIGFAVLAASFGFEFRGTVCLQGYRRDTLDLF
jgi:hypothetical protein